MSARLSDGDLDNYEVLISGRSAYLISNITRDLLHDLRLARAALRTIEWSEVELTEWLEDNTQGPTQTEIQCRFCFHEQVDGHDQDCDFIRLTAGALPDAAVTT